MTRFISSLMESILNGQFLLLLIVLPLARRKSTILSGKNHYGRRLNAPLEYSKADSIYSLPHQNTGISQL